MSAKATFWAWEQELNHATKIVLLSLANYSNDQDESWHGMKSLSKACGLSRRSIITHLQKLESLGLLTIIGRKRDGVLNDTNVYKLNINIESSSAKSSPGQVKEIHHPSEGDSLPLVKEIHHPSEGAAHKSKKESKKEPKRKLKEASPSDLCPSYIDQELWDEYLATRKGVKASNKPRALKTLINKLNKIEEARPGDGLIALENANEGSWKSVYPVKHENKQARAPSRDNLSIFEQVEQEEKSRPQRAAQTPLNDPFNNGFIEGVVIDG